MQTMAAIITAMYIKYTSLLFWTNIKRLEYGSVTYPVGWGLSLGTSPDLGEQSIQCNIKANLHVHK